MRNAQPTELCRLSLSFLCWSRGARETSMIYFYRPRSEASEGYVFTGVCYSVTEQGAEVWHQMHHGIGHMVRGRCCPEGGVETTPPPRPGSKITTPPPGQHLPPGQGQRSQHLPPPLWTTSLPPWTTSHRDYTTTGMYFCVIFGDLKSLLSGWPWATHNSAIHQSVGSLATSRSKNSLWGSAAQNGVERPFCMVDCLLVACWIAL